MAQLLSPGHGAAFPSRVSRRVSRGADLITIWATHQNLDECAGLEYCRAGYLVLVAPRIPGLIYVKNASSVRPPQIHVPEADPRERFLGFFFGVLQILQSQVSRC